MDEKARFLSIWEKEAPVTRKVLSRIPEGSDYRPDPKSRTAREIAWLILRESAVLVDGLEKGTMDWVEEPAPPTMKAVLDEYDRQQEQWLARMKKFDAARWDDQVPFLFQGQEVMRASGIDSGWGFLLDMIHHRGQITTYLRAMGSTVPQIYGPSADEGM